MSPRATLIRGDGIGPEITAAALAVLDAAGVRIDWDEQLAGVAAMEETGTPLPDATVESIRQTQVALKGPLTTPVGTGFRSVNVALRKEFDLYANVRPAKSLLPGGRYDHVDIVLVRENTEGLYIGFETTIPMPGEPKAVAASVAIVTRRGCQRVVRYAFEYAVAHRRKKVTICHKANILKAVSGLFLEVGREVSREYAGRVAVDDIIVDACAMKLVLDPTPFDVIVTTNMFGDILSDEIAGLVGGLGLAPGANFGERAAIFEAVHGSAPDIAGRGVANPSALLFAACMMLEHMGEPDAARRIRQALEDTLREGEVRTRDVGGNASTQAFADAVSRRLG
ncbi:MAG: isocitrate/isopropylmalate dehydrogenase family protein [Gemmatimonadetes bacterium]|nr:isocitrate/isopropylmalate dehydrogenase family protein [Gemmatimonadota bacterium]